MMKIMTARFTGTCAETGKPLKRGTTIVYDSVERKAYHPDSQKARDHGNGMPDNDGQLVEAQTEAIFDNWYAANYDRERP